MRWIPIYESSPLLPGKYLVKTITTMDNTHRLECDVTIGDKGAKFHVSNQIVTHWLDE